MEKKIYESKSINGKEVKIAKFICPARFKALPEEGEGIFECYVSVFGNADSYGEVVDKGAFKDFLAENFPRYPKGVWSHDWDQPISKTLEAREDEFGLYIKAKLVLEVQRAAECYALMKAEVITDFSFGYGVDEDYQDGTDGLRHLKKLSIYEYSPVLVGANRRAEMIGVKSENGKKEDEGSAAGDTPAPEAAPAAAPVVEEAKPTPEEEQAKAIKAIGEGIKAANSILEAVKTAIGTLGGPTAVKEGQGDEPPAPGDNDAGDNSVDTGTDNEKKTAKLILKEARGIDKSVERLIIKAKQIIKS